MKSHAILLYSLSHQCESYLGPAYPPLSHLLSGHLHYQINCCGISVLVSQCLWHSPHLISPCRHYIISHHYKKECKCRTIATMVQDLILRVDLELLPSNIIP